MTAPLDSWAVVELMGHRRVAGRISEEVRFGVPMCRVDTPDGDGFRTALYGGPSIYGVHLVDEQTAREAAKYTSPAPFTRQLPEVSSAGSNGSAGLEDDFNDGSDGEVVDLCPGCDDPIAELEGASDFESIVIEGQLWHRECAGHGAGRVPHTIEGA